MNGYLPELHGLALTAFAALQARFELELAPETSPPHPRENSVQLRNLHASVSVHFEALVPALNASVSLLDPTSRGFRVHRTCPLSYLLQLRCPEQIPWLLQAGRTAGEGGESLETVLGELADVLSLSAHDLLAGDFRVMEQLAPLIAADRRADHKRRFGTSTGESPRFSKRPSLAELYGDVTEDCPWLRVPRTVQAVHDYGFKPEEIAIFLTLTPAQVLAMLAEWDSMG